MLAIAATAKLYMPHIMFAWPIVLHTQVLWVMCVLNTPTGIYSEGLLQTTTPQTWGIHSVSDWLHQQVQRSCDFIQDHHQTGKPEITVSPPTVDVTYNNCCICKALSTADNPSHPSTHLTPLTPLLILPISPLYSSHPSHGLFSLLPSGRRYRNIQTTTRLQNSFFPEAVWLLNTLLTPNFQLE